MRRENKSWQSGYRSESRGWAKSSTNIESLPDKLLFKILVHVPPQDILNGARLVCRRWHRIINSPNFSHANLQYSPPGLLIQYWCGKRHSFFAAMQQGRIKISELNYEFKNYSMGSCNGLILDNNNNNSMGSDPGIYVVNPTTGQRYALPSISLKGVHYSCAVMAYVAASKEYKVVLTYSYSSDSVTNVHCCAILTVGVDKYWRHINTKHLSLKATEFFIGSPIIAGGFIHWRESETIGLLTLNVETEVFTSTPVPQRCCLKYYLSRGSCLTMVVACGDLSWEVWELKQEESGEWMMMFEIDLEAQKWRLEELFAKCSDPLPNRVRSKPDDWEKCMILEPVGWLKYGEVLVLHSSNPSRVCFLYNVRTQEIDSFVLNHSFVFSRFRFHRNSLVHLVL